MRILALDIATKCGFAISGGDSGMWNFTARRKEPKELRLTRLREHIEAVHQEEDIELLVFEAVRCFRNVQAVIVQSELQGVVKAWCIDNDVPWEGVTSSTIKKHGTGNGNASKQLMIDTAAEFFDVLIVSDDHADALWLLHLVENTEDMFD